MTNNSNRQFLGDDNTPPNFVKWAEDRETLIEEGWRCGVVRGRSLQAEDEEQMVKEELEKLKVFVEGLEARIEG